MQAPIKASTQNPNSATSTRDLHQFNDLTGCEQQLGRRGPGLECGRLAGYDFYSYPRERHHTMEGGRLHGRGWAFWFQFSATAVEVRYIKNVGCIRRPRLSAAVALDRPTIVKAVCHTCW